MKRFLSILLTFLLLCCIAPQSVNAESRTGTTYYVDSNSGSDNNDGTSKNSAWKTLNKVNEMTFSAGDVILFKSGEIFRGTLELKGQGVEDAPIIIDKYDGDKKPLFVGEEASNYVIYLNNTEYIELNNLDISANYTTKGERKGVYVYAKDKGVLNHVYLRNLDIHDIKNNQVYTNNNSFKNTGGIIVQIVGNTIPTKYDDLRIENCNIDNVDRTGMMLVISSWANRTGANYGSGRWYPSTNVVVENNNFKNIGGDGIVVQQTDGALIQHNIFNGFAERNQNICYNCAAWAHNADNTIFQFNEGMNGNSTLDGMPWDSDGYSNNTLFQYNYSHDNDGGAFLLISYGAGDNTSGVADMRDATFRYNISENDRYALITMTNPLGDNQIYNNVFYVGPGINVNAHLVGNDSNKELGLTLSNNIFYVDEKGGVSGRLNGNWNSKVVYDNNAYYSKASGKITAYPQDSNAIKEDPKFVAEGSGEEGYKLQSNSPMINSGKYIFDNGNRDYYGNTLYNGIADIGVYEYSDEDFEVPTDKNESSEVEVNIFNDPGFESGGLANQGTKNAWAGYGSRKTTNALDNVRSGNYAAELGSVETGLNYEITGLKPNTKYKASIWAKLENASGPKATMAVQYFENGNTGKITKTINSEEYTEYTLEFTTGSNQTYAWFFVYTSSNKVWVDDAKLTEVKNEEIDLTNLKELLVISKEKLNSNNAPENLVVNLREAINLGDEVVKYEFAKISIDSVNKAVENINSALDNVVRFENTALLEDLNNDENIDLKDLKEAIKYIGKSRELFNDNWDNAKIADLNFDNAVDYRDIKLLADKIIKVEATLDNITANESVEAEVYEIGDTFEYTYKIENLNSLISQDLVINYNDKMLKLKEVNTVLNSRNTYHVFAKEDIENATRLVLGVANEKYALPVNNDLIKLTFEIIGEGSLKIVINDKNILLDGSETYNKIIVKENVTTSNKEEVFGDINGDGQVTLSDIAIVSKNYGEIDNSNILSIKSDLDKDGVITKSDIEILINILISL